MNTYYKDSKPENTVITLLNILNAKGIHPSYTWLESIPGAYSVIVSIPCTTISANGKGSTTDLALASGLAELIERLQNFLHFRLSDAFSFSAKEIQNLFFSSTYSAEVLSPLQINSWFSKVDSHNSTSLKDIICKSEYSKSSIYARYTRRSNPSDELYIPYTVLDYFYGSNGMAAGNTYSEALVQALSEIVERHVAFRLLSGENRRDDIFDITDAYLVNYPSTYPKFKAMHDNGYSIHILDFSLKGVFPVIGLLAINLHDLSYFINLGCHPNIDIAVHRAINEFLQGRKISEVSDLQLFYTDFTHVKLTKNLEHTFHDGTGTFPLSCLTSTSKSSRLPSIWLRSYSSNDEMLHFYEDLLCDQLGKEIFIQYQSTLDFPTIHVVIPNFSEVVPLTDITSLKKLLQIQKGKEEYISFVMGNSWDASALTKLLDSFTCIPTMSLGNLYKLPIPTIFNPLQEISTAHILMCLYILQNDYKSAYTAALSHLHFLTSSHSSANHNKYRFVVSLLYMFANEYTPDEIEAFLLSNGYPQSIIQEYIRLLSPPGILDLIPRITCPNCTECEFSDLCCYEDECAVLLHITQ